MSMQPPYQQPDQPVYAQQSYNFPGYFNGPVARTRPGSVTGIAITGIVLGSLGILCSGSSIFLNAAALANGGRVALAPNMPPLGHNLLVFSVFQCVLNTLVSLVLLIGGIGALSLKKWARAILMPWSVFAIVWAIVIAVVAVMWMNPEMSRASRAITQNSAFLTGQDIGRNIGAIFVSVLFCVVPILILTMWNRADVKSAFGVGPELPTIPPGYGATPNYPGYPYGQQ